MPSETSSPAECWPSYTRRVTEAPLTSGTSGQKASDRSRSEAIALSGWDWESQALRRPPHVSGKTSRCARLGKSLEALQTYTAPEMVTRKRSARAVPQREIPQRFRAW